MTKQELLDILDGGEYLIDWLNNHFQDIPVIEDDPDLSQAIYEASEQLGIYNFLEGQILRRLYG